MVDNTQIIGGGTGDTIRDIDRGTGGKTQVMQLDVGGPAGGGESLVSSLNPLPVATTTNPDQAERSVLVGDPLGDWAGVNLFEQVIDDTSGIGFNVKILNYPPSGFNITQIGGSSVLSAGVGGTLVVGGNLSPGNTPTLNPTLVAGVDAGGLLRNVLTDTTGRLQTSATVQNTVFGATNNQVSTEIGIVPPPARLDNLPAVAVQEGTHIDGLNFIDLLSQILTELRVLTYQQSLLVSMLGSDASADPRTLRTDPMLLN